MEVPMIILTCAAWILCAVIVVGGGYGVLQFVEYIVDRIALRKGRHCPYCWYMVGKTDLYCRYCGAVLPEKGEIDA